MTESYKLVKQLGVGSYGKCFLVEAQKSKQECVIKQIDIRQMTVQEKEETINEARILGSLDHPYIIKLREAYISKKGKLCIVMDFADGGDLCSLIKSRSGQRFPEQQVLSWFIQICLALKHVHDRKILHRDLKSQNVFLTKEGNIKLGDFGIAKVLSQTMENAKTVVGTPYYLSPELIDNKPYNFKSDIWALGILLYELCALEPPFNAGSIHGLALKIVRGVYSPLPTEYSRDIKSLVSMLLAVDPRQRPTINEVLKMPIIMGRIRQFLSENKYNDEFSHTIIHRSPVLEENSRRKKRKMLKTVLERRVELDHGTGAKEMDDREKIVCEMSALVLEDSEGNEPMSPEPEEMKRLKNMDSVIDDEKVIQFRECLAEMMGRETFNEAYEVVRKITFSAQSDNLSAYAESLKHMLNRKQQKKFIPMIKTLVEMESALNE
jgi:serine/threonine protein kinase